MFFYYFLVRCCLRPLFFFIFPIISDILHSSESRWRFVGAIAFPLFSAIDHDLSLSDFGTEFSQDETMLGTVNSDFWFFLIMLLIVLKDSLFWVHALGQVDFQMQQNLPYLEGFIRILQLNKLANEAGLRILNLSVQWNKEMKNEKYNILPKAKFSQFRTKMA